MIEAKEITDDRLLDSLGSKVCPACGGGKNRKQTLCYRDYRRLPVPMRNSLYARLGRGYREAVVEALAFLDAERFHEPCPACGEKLETEPCPSCEGVPADPPCHVCSGTGELKQCHACEWPVEDRR